MTPTEEDEMRSLEVIQKTGPNAVIYGNDTRFPGEHAKVFTGWTAIDQANKWLSGEVHFWNGRSPQTPCERSMLVETMRPRSSDTWDGVECGECLLEQPPTNV